jgi:iron uptake system component EfeO
MSRNVLTLTFLVALAAGACSSSSTPAPTPDAATARPDAATTPDAAGTTPDGSATSTDGATTDGGGQSAQALVMVKTYINSNLEDLIKAARDLQAAAPAPDADGWNASADAAAVTAMKTSWRAARKSYERVEGAIAVLFGELDESTDQRYDAFVETMKDDNLFDDVTVTGIHAIERILWVDSTPASVITFEKGLTNYKVAAYPANLQEATDFKTKLCARLINDIQMMIDGFKPVALDPAAAYRGVIGSMAEQREKITKAETGEEESRYADETLADMRSNVEGGQATQGAFRSWLLSVAGGAELDAKITAGFKRVTDAYGTADAKLPPLPDTWNATMPSATDLATPFGKIYGVLSTESDDKNPDSLVTAMNKAGDLMGIKAEP